MENGNLSTDSTRSSTVADHVLLTHGRVALTPGSGRMRQIFFLMPSLPAISLFGQRRAILVIVDTSSAQATGGLTLHLYRSIAIDIYLVLTKVTKPSKYKLS